MVAGLADCRGSSAIAEVHCRESPALGAVSDLESGGGTTDEEALAVPLLVAATAADEVESPETVRAQASETLLAALLPGPAGASPSLGFQALFTLVAGRQPVSLSPEQTTRALRRVVERGPSPEEPGARAKMREVVEKYLAMRLDVHSGVAGIIVG
ncbi:MAG: hypothetical protein V2A73_11010 [Pseudomonadota bacterium]